MGGEGGGPQILNTGTYIRAHYIGREERAYLWNGDSFAGGEVGWASRGGERTEDVWELEETRAMTLWITVLGGP